MDLNLGVTGGLWCWGVVPVTFHLILKRIQNLQKVKNHWASSTRTKEKKGKNFRETVNQLPLNHPRIPFFFLWSFCTFLFAHMFRRILSYLWLFFFNSTCISFHWDLCLRMVSEYICSRCLLVLILVKQTATECDRQWLLKFRLLNLSGTLD